jgi:hypothetical protein
MDINEENDCDFLFKEIDLNIGEEHNTVMSSLTSNSQSSTLSEGRLHHADDDLTLEEKKRKIEELYNDGTWLAGDKYEIQKIQNVVRKLIFKKIKFCKGEGVSMSGAKGNKRKSTDHTLGKTHERADLTEKKGYVYEVMRECGMDEESKSLSERAIWWKTYNELVIYEIRQKRGKVNYKIRESCFEGELYVLLFILFTLITLI